MGAFPFAVLSPGRSVRVQRRDDSSNSEAATSSAGSKTTSAGDSTITSTSKTTSRHSTSSSSSSSSYSRRTTRRSTTDVSSTAASQTAATSSSTLDSTSATSTSIYAVTSESPVTTSNAIQSTTAASPTTSLAAAAASTTPSLVGSTSHHSSISSGAIAAAVVVPVVVLAALAAFLFFFFRRRSSHRSFTRQVSLVSRADAPSPIDDGEVPLEKDLELSPIQRTAPAFPAAAGAAIDHSNHIPRRPVGLAPVSSGFQIEPASSESLFSSARTTPANDTPMTPHHPSGALLMPRLPEMGTGHFFDTPRVYSNGSTDPFDDPRAGYTPSPIERHQDFPGIRAPTVASSPSPVTYNADTLQSEFSSPTTPIRPTQRATRPNNLPLPFPAGLAPPPAIRTPGGESDRFSMMSNDDEDGNDDFGTVEYASAARVAQVAQVVGGPAKDGDSQPGSSNRRSVGVVSVKAGNRSSWAMSGGSSPIL